MNKIWPIDKTVVVKLTFCLLIFSTIISGCSRSGSEEQPQTTQTSQSTSLEQDQDIKKTMITPDTKMIMDVVRSLSSYKRAMGSPGEKEACTYLKKTFEEYGYSTQVQVFPYGMQKVLRRKARDDEFWDVDVAEDQKEGESQNLIAIKKPYADNSKDIIIISVHYDDTGYGAVIDNATGVSVLMEAARVTAKIRVSAEIRFILFGGEERGLKGSRYYVSKLSKEEKSNIIADINLDYLGEKGPNNLIMATIDGKENRATALFKDFKEVEIIKAPLSDYISFARAEIPSVSLGQLSVPWEVEDSSSSEEEREKALIQFEMSRLEEKRLKEVADMVIKALSKYFN